MDGPVLAASSRVITANRLAVAVVEPERVDAAVHARVRLHLPNLGALSEVDAAKVFRLDAFGEEFW